MKNSKLYSLFDLHSREKMDHLKFSFIKFLQQNGIKETNIPIDLRNELHQQDIHLETERAFEPPHNYSTDHFFSDFVPTKSVDIINTDPDNMVYISLKIIKIKTQNYSNQQKTPNDVIHNSNPFELKPMDSSQHGSLDEEHIFDPKRSEFEKIYSYNPSDTTHGSYSGTTIGDDEEPKV